MKVKTKKVPYTYAKTIQPPKRDKLRKPSLLFRLLIRILSIPDMLATKFSYTARRMKEVKKEPCLILMNHSSFIDLKIASKIFFPKPYYIVSTMDGFIGKHTLMRAIGCIPTRKFVADVALMRDISHALKERKTSVLLNDSVLYLGTNGVDHTAESDEAKITLKMLRFKIGVLYLRL